ncbi:TIGR02206 family membrane protein [Haloferula rosea]|uniref:TIGR02206 family membrane protein n=1 Tax=Haloferula rosea TaxID=490093 RepID=A0A934REV2_9BACT|nr:TIGR02206 family membrane protein [Haloferula rosea]MBK1828358.1 TIGR02206 family membrane protein [Haloferula rosea]
MPDPLFTPFSSQHAWTVVAGICAIALCLLMGRRGGSSELAARSTLAFLNLSVFAVSSWAWSQVTRESDIDNAVPLHLCDLAAFTAGFALITRNHTLILLTYYWGLAGTIQGIATPAIDVGYPHPAFFSFFIHHFAVVAAALYFPIVGGWRADRPWWRSPLIAFAWLNLYLVVAVIANHFLGTNFGFLARKPVNPSLLDHLGPHPTYIVWLEGIALIMFLLLTLPIRKHRGPRIEPSPTPP